ncbi:MAG: hypothetical protein AW10_03249 [Candidatus Accumulibacter appositus]|uniref:Uncharacterized protein n=1 Tax=Candidatus Accumulibacter appositus TaxID=1454003 RepID=A0A011NS47_9PROT|nr:hypothetical protein [Accumulibacter sp.]EXI78166.1 MAG: hypothetical protein AW10_03249 [Candidatus Accumulibacter appositus]HRF04707.1 hypothetical protein [Accumulibacter sp.]
MSSAATLSSAEAILAAAKELKLRRLASMPAPEPPAKAKKARKPTQTVRCRLRIPHSEYRQLIKLKKRLASRGVPSKKGELFRAGLLLLGHVDLIDLKVAIRNVIAPEARLYKVK